MRWFTLSARLVASVLSVTALLVLVLLALYASLGRLYMPRLAEQREAIELYLQENLPVPVTFSSIEGDWRQLSPIVRLKNLETRTVIKGSEWDFQADDFIVEIDVIRSVLYRQPVLRDILIEGGAIRVQGKPMLLASPDSQGSAVPSALSDLLAAVFNLGTVTISDSRMQVDFPDIGHSRELVLSASLQRHENFRRLESHVDFLGDKPGSLSVLVEADQSLTGSLNVIELYTRWDNVQLDHWLRLMDWGDEFQVAQAISGEAWGHWVPGDDIRLSGHLSAPSLAVNAQGKRWPALEDFSASFVMERNEQLQWDIHVPTLAFNCQGIGVPWQQLRFRFGPGRAGLLQLGEIDLSTTHALLDVLGLGTEALRDLQPAGQLRAASWAFQRKDDGLDWVFRSYLHEVSVGSWHGTPTASGVSGYVEVDRRGGFVDLDAGPSFTMGFPRVYASPMQFDRARARVAWQLDDNGVKVSSSVIHLDSHEGNAQGLLALDLPKAGQGDPWMTLVIGLQDAPAELRNKYIPMTISDGLQRWLDASITGGVVKQGGFIFDGPLKPADRKPVVQLFLEVEGAGLHYHPDWPALHDIDGRVLVDDGDVSVWASEARLYESRVRNARVDVGKDETDNLNLAVHGELSGPTADVLRLLGSSPLKATLGNAFSGWRAEGTYRAGLVLGVSLGEPRMPFVAVDAQLDANTLHLQDQRLVFDTITGPLAYYSDSGLASPGLAARLWGEPLTAVITSQRVPDGVDTRIKAQADVSLDSLRNWLDWPWMQFANGKAAVQGEVRIRPGMTPDLLLDSSLEGIAIDLPAPFAKAAAEHSELRASIPFGDGLMDIAIGDHLARIGVLRLANEPLKVGLALGRVPFRIPQREGVSIYGRVQQFDWAQWQAPVESMVDALADKDGDAVDAAGDATFRVSGVFAEEAMIFGQRFDSVRASVNRDAGRWWVGIQSDTIAGRVGLPLDDDPSYRIDLDRLVLAEGLFADAPGDDIALVNAAAAEDPLKDVDWRAWPPMQVSVRKLMVGSADFGQWSFNVLPDGQRLRIERLRASSGLVYIDSEGGGAWAEWWRAPEGQGTRLHASVLFYDLERALQAIGLELGVTAKEAVMAVDLQWPDSPLLPSVQGLQGTAGFSLKKGFLKTGNRAQTGMLKVLTVFNLDSILRRIKLDFSDLYQEGLAFDEATAEWSMQDGWLTITEPVEFRGPASQIVLQGRVDLVNDVLDNRLTVTLPVASSLPWLAAIAGGLPAAAGVYVASKVLEKQVDSFTSVVYEVKGPRADPEIKFQRLIDADSLWPSWMKPRSKKATPANEEVAPAP